MWFMDGGTVWNINIASAINGCLTKVDRLEKITVDVFVCGTEGVNSDAVEMHTIHNWKRGEKLRRYYKGMQAM